MGCLESICIQLLFENTNYCSIFLSTGAKNASSADLVRFNRCGAFGCYFGIARCTVYWILLFCIHGNICVLTTKIEAWSFHDIFQLNLINLFSTRVDRWWGLIVRVFGGRSVSSFCNGWFRVTPMGHNQMQPRNPKKKVSIIKIYRFKNARNPLNAEIQKKMFPHCILFSVRYFPFKSFDRKRCLPLFNRLKWLFAVLSGALCGTAAERRGATPQRRRSTSDQSPGCGKVTRNGGSGGVGVCGAERNGQYGTLTPMGFLIEFRN